MLATLNSLFTIFAKILHCRDYEFSSIDEEVKPLKSEGIPKAAQIVI